MFLTNQVAIITGGGNGLGREACQLFARKGATVIVADWDFDSALDVANEISQFGRALAIKVNVADRTSVDEMVQTVLDNFGRIDILINNAGITRDKTLLKMTQEQWQAVIDVNQTGVFNCTSAVAPHMVLRGYGRIISTSSIVRDGNVGQTNYAATKAAVVAMTKTWAKELGKKGITANAVAPGFMKTNMTANMPPEVLEGMKQQVPLKRLGEPSDVANVYYFLATNEYVNGAVIPVDGGLTV